MCDQDAHQIEQAVAAVRASQKYGNVCERTIWRIAAEEWARQGTGERSLKRTIKRTKSKLHQVYGAYQAPIDYEQQVRSLQVAYAGEGAAIRAACGRVLSLHTSTRERAPILERFYAQVFSHIGTPRSLLDLACGLHPLSLPWMALGTGATYHAYDIDAERVAFLNQYFFLARVRGCAHLQDIVCDPPTLRADVALLLKSSTCLERQRKGATLELLDEIDARYVVVSFPVRSLGRHAKGMPHHYERTFGAMVQDRGWPLIQLRFSTELVFIVDKGQERP